MSDAIELSIGGTNKGFVAVLNDTEKRAKESTAKTNVALDQIGAQGVKGRQKIGTDLNGIAADFAKCTSLSGALEMGLGRLGSSFKIGGIVTLASAFVKAIYDATQNSRDLNFEIEKLGRRNNYNVGGFSMGELEGNLSDTKGAREKNWGSMMSQDNKPNWIKAAGSFWQDELANAGEFWSGHGGKSLGQVAGVRGERDEELRKIQLADLSRIAEKERQIFDIQTLRIKGAHELADVKAMEAVYLERIRSAHEKAKEAGSTDTSLQSQLQQEMAMVKAGMFKEAMTRGDIRARAEIGADLSVRNARMEAGPNSRMSIGLSRMGDQAQLARLDYENAKAKARRFPDDPDAASAVIVAQKAMEQLGEQVKIFTRGLVSDGNQIKSLNTIATGNRREERNAKEAIAQADKMERVGLPTVTTGTHARKILSGADRDMDGNIKGDVDPLTTSRLAGGAANAVRATGYASMYGQHGIPAGGSHLPSGPGGYKAEGIGAMLAKSEMQHKHGVIGLASDKAARQEAIEKSKVESVKAGTASPGQALASIAQILTAWNN